MSDMRRLPGAEAREAARLAAEFLRSDTRVRLVYLFGSAANETRAHVRDVDLAILTEPVLPLDELMRLRADAATAAGGVPIDLVSLNDASVVLAQEIADTGRCLFARSPDIEVEFVTRARARYWDFKPFLEEQWRLTGERLESGADVVLRPEAVRERLLKLEEVVSNLEALQPQPKGGW